MKTVHNDALQPQLRWLILTDNQLESLPSTIGRCNILQKLMLSGNNLESLPEGISNCRRLELVRLASNRLNEVRFTILKTFATSSITRTLSPRSSQNDTTHKHSALSLNHHKKSSHPYPFFDCQVCHGSRSRTILFLPAAPTIRFGRN